MKIWFRRIHLYLALVAGLFIFISCFTGAILVFEKELTQYLNHKRYYNEVTGTALLLQTLLERVQVKVPEAQIGSIKVYSDPSKTVEINFSQQDKEITKAESGKTENTEKEKKPGKDKGETRKTAFVNRYTGEVIELYNYRETFYFKVFALHRWLLGGKESIGNAIVGISTLIFVFILLTGLILWWPKNRFTLRQRLKIKQNASAKRFTHDLHVVVGFYASIFLLISALTGIVITYKWASNIIFAVTGSSSEREEAPKSANFRTSEQIKIDEAFEVVASKLSTSVYVNIQLPKDSSSVFAANILPADAQEQQSDTYFIDLYSKKLIKTAPFSNLNTGQKVRAAIKPLHTGSIFGLPSKIIAFVIALCGASFPATGFLIWLNRTRKQERLAIK